ncbi:MAG: FHA domain-containing protein [Planctomycetota bacterium]|nr:MAG: FHA domain-containing protein [Planctomycetota bacterium]
MIPLQQVIERYAPLSRDEFTQKVRCDWLVTDSEHQSSSEEAATVVFQTKQALEKAAPESDQNMVLAYPIIKRSVGETSDIITLGRASSNDIVIQDGSISKVHAYFGWDSRQQRRTICDLNSTNGTYLNQEKLIPNLAYLLKTGDQLILGRLSLTYYTPRSFYNVFLS